MLGLKLKQLRLARGYSLDELVAKSGGVVSKQAISKYEKGEMNPSPSVLAKLATSLEVKVADIAREQSIQVDILAYRKSSGLPKKEQARLENLTRQSLEDRLRLQELVAANHNGSDIPVRNLNISSIEDTENAAEDLRDQWNLGRDPIASVMGVLEDHRVHVIEIEAKEKFDGMSAVAYSKNQKVAAAVVVVRREEAGERQRFSLAHELGHLVLKVSGKSQKEEEKIAHRFGAAFLAPKDSIIREVGRHRTAIDIRELLLLKKRFGMSVQALLYRLKDLEIINQLHFVQWFQIINKRSWRRKEPNVLAPERPEWLRQNVLKAFAEGLIGQEDAETLLGEKIDHEIPLSLVKKRSFMKLPIEERRRLLADQADKNLSHYEQNTESRELGAGDFIDY